MSALIGMTEDLYARLMLSHSFEPGDEALGVALTRFGARTVVNVLDQGPEARAALRLGVGAERWDGSAARRGVDAELAEADHFAVAFIGPGDPAGRWPTQLDDLGLRTPIALRAVGAAPLRTAAVRSVAIVGARACTRYGEAVADMLAAQLSGMGWCIVSGGAFGIDAAAHRGAVAVGGVSIAVSAAGADLPAPAGNTALYMRLYDSGCVISEVPLGRRPTKSRFLVRNRVIAALTRGVVVVEAADRSGARSTAREAASLRRVVAAVPGPVTSEMSVGCHELIRDNQAVLVTDASDVAELLEPLTSSHQDCFEQLDLTGQLIVSALDHDAVMSAEALAGHAGVPTQELAAQLLLLERNGAVKRKGSGWMRAC